MWFIGKVVSVYDGDTCQVVFNVDGDFVKFPVRVTGIDTPERKGTLKEFGTEVGVKTREMIDDKIVYLKAGAFEKYGRLLGSVYACLPEGGTVNISELLIA
jgi:endonuclease YncB( thermonuclease family)